MYDPKTTPLFSKVSVRKPWPVGSCSMFLFLSGLHYRFLCGTVESNTAVDYEEAIPSVLAQALLPVKSG